MTDNLQRQLGKALAERRTRAGLMQHELAHRITYDRTTVNHAEHGRRVPAAEFWHACDRVLDARGALLTLYQAWQDAKQQAEAARRTAHRGTVVIPARTIDRLPSRVGILTTEPEPAMICDEDPIMAAARESARFTSFAEATNVGPHTLDQLRADIARIALTFQNRPVAPIFAEARELRDRAFELLEGHQHPAQTRDLYLAAGELCTILAEACLGLGRLAAAETQARTAYLCAELAGHNGLRCFVRSVQAMIALWDERPADAVTLAHSGWDYPPEAGTARVRTAMVEARAHARLGRDDAVDEALARADTAREQVIGTDEPGGYRAFPVANQLFWAGTANLRLGGEQRHHKVEQDATEAIRLFEAEPPEQRNLGCLVETRLDLAGARLATGDLEGCTEQASEAIRASARRRTYTLTGRLHQLANRLTLPPYHTTPAAVGLRDEILTLTATQPPALPAGADQ